MRAAKSFGGVWAEAESGRDIPIAAMQPAASIAPRRKLQIIDDTPQQQAWTESSVYTEPTILFARYRSYACAEARLELSHCIRIDAGAEIDCDLVLAAVALGMAKAGSALSVWTDVVDDRIL